MDDRYEQRVGCQLDLIDVTWPLARIIVGREMVTLEFWRPVAAFIRFFRFRLRDGSCWDYRPGEITVSPYSGAFSRGIHIASSNSTDSPQTIIVWSRRQRELLGALRDRGYDVVE